MYRIVSPVYICRWNQQLVKKVSTLAKGAKDLWYPMQISQPLDGQIQASESRIDLLAKALITNICSVFHNHGNYPVWSQFSGLTERKQQECILPLSKPYLKCSLRSFTASHRPSFCSYYLYCDWICSGLLQKFLCYVFFMIFSFLTSPSLDDGYGYHPKPSSGLHITAFFYLAFNLFSKFLVNTTQIPGW